MVQCQFIYQRFREGISIESWCNEIVKYARNPRCYLHRQRHYHVYNFDLRTEDEGSMDVGNSFPWTLTNAEERICVTEARRRMSPETVMMRSCAVCGRLQLVAELLYRTAREISAVSQILRGGNYYDTIPRWHFIYGGAHCELDGLVLNRSGFLSDDEVTEGMPLTIRICKTCDSSLSKNKLPDLALANGLWSGIGEVPELSNLSWIEEKLIV